MNEVKCDNLCGSQRLCVNLLEGLRQRHGLIMASAVNLYETDAIRTVTGPAIRPGGLALTDRAVSFCDLPPGARILDVGCGSGATVVHLNKNHDFRAEGIDLSRQLLAEAKQRQQRVALIRGRAEMLPFGNDRFAAVFSECVLSLVPSPAAALAEWRRVLTPGGYLILSDLYARQASSVKMPGEGAVNCCLNGAIGQEALIGLVSAAGFEVLLFEDHTRCLKQLAAQLVWQYGSMAAFWSAAGVACAGAGRTGTGQPGYCLLVARNGGVDG